MARALPTPPRPAANLPAPAPLTPARMAVWALVGLMLLGNVVQGAKIYDLFWEDASRFGYAAQLLPAALFTLVALVRRHWVAAGATIAVTAIVAGSHAVFVGLSGEIANYNSVATFAPLLTGIVFYECNLPLEKVLRVMLVLMAVYVLSYVALNATIRQNYASATQIMLRGHNDGDNRVALSQSCAAFVALYGLRARAAPLLLRAGLVLVGLAALVLSDSRLYILITVAVFALAAANLLIRPVRVAIFAAVMGGVLLTLLSFVFPEWNPYNLFVSDSSGSYRATEFGWLVRIVSREWLLGVGTPGQFPDLQDYVQQAYAVPRNIWLFNSDFGAIGVYFQLGLAGLLLFLFALGFCILPRWGSTLPEMQALQLTAFVSAVFGVMSPMILMDPGAIFFTASLAIWARERQARSAALRWAESQVVTRGGPLARRIGV